MEKSEILNVLVDQYRDIDTGELWQRQVDLSAHLNNREVSVITGVRRSGKSSLLSLIAAHLGSKESILYLNFEDIRLVSFELADFQKALDAWLELKPSTPERIFFFYDEIQAVDGWQRWIAQLAKKRHYKVFITGSNSKLLSGELASLLTGRHLPLTLYPFSFGEVAHNLLKHGRESLNSQTTVNPTLWFDSEFRTEVRRILLRYMEYGGFPRVLLGQEKRLLSSYFTDIVLKDIVVRHGVRNERALLELGSILMADATKLMNKSRLASAVGLKDAETVNSYLHYFTETYLGFDVKGYSHSKQTALRSQSKFYAVDHALASFVGGTVSPNVGATLENMVYIELLRRRYAPSYWRSKEGHEVDFIIKQGRRISHAIQVSASLAHQETRDREVRALRAAATEIRPEKLLIITLDSTVYTDVNDISVISFEEWAMSGFGGE